MSKVKTVIDVVVRHEKEIQELKRLVTPMMEFETRMPTKLVGPNLVEILNAAGFYKKKEWVGLTDAEIDEGNKQSWVTKQAWESAVWWASEKLKEKNNGT